MVSFVNKENSKPIPSQGDDLAELFNFGKLYSRGGKRLLDFILVLISAPLVIAMLLPVVLLVALDGGKPFYCQDRVGRHGRIFRLWKLRSMVPDADEKLEQFLASNPEARAEWNRTQKLKHDPRITTIGRYIRKSSIDELPQLWNVLRGDMSLIGPRPMMIKQKDLYPGKDYYLLRPGITGSWQVSERNETAFADRARYDTSYYRSLSLRKDVGILLKTVSVVLRGTGY